MSSLSARNASAAPATASQSRMATLTLDAALAAANGDPRVALETVLAERNNLHQQNVQLWKLMEKSRSGYASSLKDLERVRSERDKALARLDLLVQSSSLIEPPVRLPFQQRSFSLESPQDSRPTVTRHQSHDNPRALPSASPRATPSPSSDQPFSSPTTSFPTQASSSTSEASRNGVNADPTPPNPQVTIHPPATQPLSSSPLEAPLELATPPSQSSASLQPRPRALARESRITLPDEATRYITDMTDSPVPSPKAPSGPNGSTSSPFDDPIPDAAAGNAGLEATRGSLDISKGNPPPRPARRRPSTPQETYASSIISTTSSRSHSRAGFSMTGGDSELQSDQPQFRLSDLDEEDLHPAPHSRGKPPSGAHLDDDSDTPPPSPMQSVSPHHGSMGASMDNASVSDVPYSQEDLNSDMEDAFQKATNGHSTEPLVNPAAKSERFDEDSLRKYPTSHIPSSQSLPSITTPPLAMSSHPLSTTQTPSPTNPSPSAIPSTKATYRSTRLTMADLPYTKVKIQGSSIKTNDRGKEVLSFVFAVHPSGDGQPSSTMKRPPHKESWMVEKLYSEILALDASVRSKLGKTGAKKLAPLPDGKLFKDHAPAKADQRKAILDNYIQTLVSGPLKSKDDICMFLSTDLVRGGAKTGIMHSGYKEGYLTKRGKNFGGWKTRFFVLQSNVLEYYESRGGQHLGSILITGAQIGRQQKSSYSRDSEDENSYRHAFLIIEAKKGPGGASVRHVLCAESDEERDSWVEVLVRYVVANPAVHKSSNDGHDELTSSSTAVEFSGSSASIATSALGPSHPSSRSVADQQGKWASRSLANDDAPKHSLDSAYTMRTDSSVNAVPPSVESHVGRRVLDRPGQVSDLPISTSLPSNLDHIPTTLAASTTASRPNVDLSHSDVQGHGERRRSPNTSAAILPSSVGSSSAPRPNNRTSFHPSFGTSKPHPGPIDRAPSPEKFLSSLDGPSKGKLISGPINGTPIPAGYKFGAKDPPPQDYTMSERDRKAKSGRFWGFGRGNPAANGSTPNNMVPRAVFGVSLDSSLAVAQIADLPAIVFRCIEYLETKNAEQEEGIYRMSGSSNVIKSLKDRFNMEGDVDLLKSDEYWDLHAITGLLKGFLRDLPTSILTRELHLRFLGIIDLTNQEERIEELSALISRLPLPNYSLLRALTAHLILIVQNANLNKMTMRNVGIVFSPTLGIPAGVFSLMLGEFERVFDIEGGKSDAEETTTETSDVAEYSNRNSRSYADGAADQLLGLAGRKLKTTDEESDENDEMSILDSSEAETENDTQDPSSPPETPGPNTYNQDASRPEAPQAPAAHAANVAAQRGLHVAVDAPDSKRVSGLPASPRPPRLANREASSPSSPLPSNGVSA